MHHIPFRRNVTPVALSNVGFLGTKLTELTDGPPREHIPRIQPRLANRVISGAPYESVGSVKVQWDEKSAAVADITGDGLADVIIVGYDDNSVWVALVPGMKSNKLGKPTIQQFFVGQAQSSFCAKPVHIELYPLQCEGDSGPLPGCKQVRGASEFALDDDSCDPIHFYWDQKKKTLRWWRN